jgi:hypothetical protein
MLLFEVNSKLGRRIRITRSYWAMIITKKHPSVTNREEDVKLTLVDPDEVRKSRCDTSVHLYYRRVDDKLICVVTKHLNKHGFIITVYLTDKIKRGEVVWKKE